MNDQEMSRDLVPMDKREAGGNNLDYDTARVREMAEELFYLWMFISHQRLIEDARDFLEEFADYPVPMIF